MNCECVYDPTEIDFPAIFIIHSSNVGLILKNEQKTIQSKFLLRIKDKESIGKLVDDYDDDDDSITAYGF